MYATCPKCGYTHNKAEKGMAACPACGLVYSKWLKSIAASDEVTVTSSTAAPSAAVTVLSELLFPAKPNVTPLEVAGYGVIWIGLAIWGWHFIAMDWQSAEIMRSFFHNVDLIFHEAGHILFMPFGRFMMFLGGSLFQVLLPLIFVVAFLWVNKDAFAASVCLWWAGQSLMDVAPYIADARALRLPLLGGGTGADTPGRHDWAYLLRQMGLLEQDTRIAAAVDFIGSGVLLIALVWGLYMLRVYYRAAMN
ncbi:MAG: hypothetical protein MI746_11810 [Pseudomonadales bacterium]|nr:hypothetical protein [Pseudomonadales bacterium]